MTGHKPLIGITTFERSEGAEFYLSANYVDVVREAGGLPVLLAPGESDCAALLDRLDGLLLTGGGDLVPDTYGGPLHPTIRQTNDERDRFELALARLSLARSLPVLGICRGLEIQVVAAGGKLMPHLPDCQGTIEHRLDLGVGHTHPLRHTVKLDPDSQLAKVMETTELEVASWHHQSTASAPADWHVTAVCPQDGVIEALEYGKRPWAIGVQWHPELTPDDPPHQKLLRAFVAAARSGIAAGLAD